MHDAPDDFVDYEDYEETLDETNYFFLKDGEYCLWTIYLNNASFTISEFVTKLVHWKNKHNYNNNGFDDLLQLIGLILPDDHKFP